MVCWQQKSCICDLLSHPTSFKKFWCTLLEHQVMFLWEQGINPRILFLWTYTDRRLVKMSMHVFVCCDVSVSGTEKEGGREGERVRGLVESPCVKVFGAYSMFWMCVYFRRTSHSFTQSTVGVALCLTSSLAPPTAVLLQPSESPISQLLKPMCVWCPGGEIGAWSPAVVLRLWSHVNSYQFRPLRSNTVCLSFFLSQCSNIFASHYYFFSLWTIVVLKHWIGQVCMFTLAHPSCWQIHYCKSCGAFQHIDQFVQVNIVLSCKSRECLCVCVVANEGGLVHCPGGPSWSAILTQTARWLMEC